MVLPEKSATSHDTRSSASTPTATTHKPSAQKSAKFHVGNPNGVLATASQTAHTTLGAKTQTVSNKSLLKRHLSKITLLDDTSTAATAHNFRPVTPERKC